MLQREEGMNKTCEYMKWQAGVGVTKEGRGVWGARAEVGVSVSGRVGREGLIGKVISEKRPGEGEGAARRALKVGAFQP